jgi:hypothetical protein
VRPRSDKVFGSIPQPASARTRSALLVSPATYRARIDSAEQWSGCANATVVVMQANKSVNVWTIETVVGDAPSISISEARRDVGWRCQRAMRAVSDVVIDATACGQDITDQANSLADRIAANISK